MNIKYLEGLFAKWMVPYEVAETGEGAIEKSKQKRFDLILMDIRLPDLDGYQVTQEIRSNRSNPNQETKIIALTATATTEEVERSIAAGMQGYLPKPYRPDQLLAILQEHLVGVGSEETAEGDSHTLSESGEDDDLEVRILGLFDHQASYARDMLAVFFMAIPPDVEKMRDLLQRPNVEELGKLAHKIKPSWAMVGFPEVSAQLQAMERMARAGASWKEVEGHLVDFLSDASHHLQQLKRISDRWS